jgi:hypothetical protein
MSEPITQLSTQLQQVVLQVLQQFGVPMILRRVTILPSDRGDPTTITDLFLCRAAPAAVKRTYDGATGTMSRVRTVVLSDPGVEPRANDELVRGDGSVAFVVTADTGVEAIRPDGVMTVAYECSLRTL